MGTSFCQVVRIIHMGQEIKDITEGNQKWQGGSPSLVINPKNKRRFIKLGVNRVRGEVKSDKEPKRIKPEPRVWAKKYFIAASASFDWLDWQRRGIKDIRFSSNPTQIKTQWVLLIESREPKIKEEINREMKGI